jgi:hypothetical protein
MAMVGGSPSFSLMNQQVGQAGSMPTPSFSGVSDFGSGLYSGASQVLGQPTDVGSSFSQGLMNSSSAGFEMPDTVDFGASFSQGLMGGFEMPEMPAIGASFSQGLMGGFEMPEMPDFGASFSQGLMGGFEMPEMPAIGASFSQGLMGNFEIPDLPEFQSFGQGLFETPEAAPWENLQGGFLGEMPTPDFKGLSNSYDAFTGLNMEQYGLDNVEPNESREQMWNRLFTESQGSNNFGGSPGNPIAPETPLAEIPDATDPLAELPVADTALTGLPNAGLTEGTPGNPVIPETFGGSPGNPVVQETNFTGTPFAGIPAADIPAATAAQEADADADAAQPGEEIVPGIEGDPVAGIPNQEIVPGINNPFTGITTGDADENNPIENLDPEGNPIAPIENLDPEGNPIAPIENLDPEGNPIVPIENLDPEGNPIAPIENLDPEGNPIVPIENLDPEGNPLDPIVGDGDKPVEGELPDGDGLMGDPIFGAPAPGSGIPGAPVSIDEVKGEEEKGDKDKPILGTSTADYDPEADPENPEADPDAIEGKDGKGEIDPGLKNPITGEPMDGKDKDNVDPGKAPIDNIGTKNPVDGTQTPGQNQETPPAEKPQGPAGNEAPQGDPTQQLTDATPGADGTNPLAPGADGKNPLEAGKAEGEGNPLAAGLSVEDAMNQGMDSAEGTSIMTPEMEAITASNGLGQYDELIKSKYGDEAFLVDAADSEVGSADARDVIKFMDQQTGEWKVKRLGDEELMDMQVRTATIDSAKQFNDGMSSGRLSFEGDLSQQNYNEQYWEPVVMDGKQFWRVKEGVNPSDAINDVFNGGEYSMDCAASTNMVLMKAKLDTIGAEGFNQHYRGLTINGWDTGTDPNGTGFLQFDGDGALDGHRGNTQELGGSSSNLRPGDLAYFNNPNVAAGQSASQGENAIYLGKDASGQPIFFGNPIGMSVGESNEYGHLSTYQSHMDPSKLLSLASR